MARYTEDLLVNALRMLIKEIALDDITVQNLVDTANINRKTFYYHFHSIADLIEWFYTQKFSTLASHVCIGPDTWMELMKNVIEYISSEDYVFYAIYKSKYAAEFRASMMRLFNKGMVKFVNSAIKIYEQESGETLHLTKAQLGYITQYYSMGFFGMIEQWLIGGMKESSEDFVNILQDLTNDNMYRTFSVLKKKVV